MLKKYLQIIENEISRAEEFARRNPLEHQKAPEQVNTIIFWALENPGWQSSQINDRYHNKKGDRISLNVEGFLRRHFLFKPDGRRECLQAIELHYNNFYRLMNSDHETARASYMEVRERRRRLTKSWPAVARVILIKLANDLKEEVDEKVLGERLEGVINKLLMPPTTKLFNNLLDRIAQSRGLLEADSVDDKLIGLIHEVEQLEDVETISPSADIEVIREENADLRSTLFGLKQELTDLQQIIHDLQETARNQAIVSFLSEMNSPSSGYLLDNVARSTQVIAGLLSQGWSPESPDMEGVVYSLKMIMDYLSRIGLAPIKSIGNQAKITMEDLSYVNYIGSEFLDQKQLKQVEFRSPGWSYKGQLISRPQAIELIQKSETEGENDHDH